MRRIFFVCLLLLIMLAFADFRFSIGGKGIFTLSFFEFWAYALLLPMFAFALPMLSLAGSRSYLSTVLFNAPSKWLFLYVLWALVSALLFWDNPDYTIQMDIKNLIPGMIAYISLLLVAPNRKELKTIQAVWFIAGFVNAYLALSQYFLSGPYPVKLDADLFQKLQITGELTKILVTGFFSHPNTFAQIIVPWFVVATVIWITSNKFITLKSFGWCLLSGLFGFVLFSTAVKGAMFWSLAGIALGVGMDKRNKLRSLALMIILWLTLIVAINTAGLYYAGRLKLLGTTTSRIDLIAVSYRLFLDKPVNFVIGGGLRNWEKYVYTWADYTFYNAHNVYLNQILMYGLIGAVLFTAFVISSIKKSITSTTIIERTLSPFPYLGALFALGGEYFFEPSFAFPIQKYQLMFVLALMTLTSRPLASRHERTWL